MTNQRPQRRLVFTWTYLIPRVPSVTCHPHVHVSVQGATRMTMSKYDTNRVRNAQGTHGKVYTSTSTETAMDLKRALLTWLIDSQSKVFILNTIKNSFFLRYCAWKLYAHTVYFLLNLYTLTSACTLSTLFSKHFLWYFKENLSTNQEHLEWVIVSLILMTLLFDSGLI